MISWSRHGIREGVVLHLAHRPPAGHAEADRGAEDPGLGQRRVDAAVGPEAVAQPGGRAEDAAGATDVLAHHHTSGVALELDVEGVVDASTRVSSAIRAPPQLGEVGLERGGRVDVGVLEEQRRIGRRLGLRRGDPVAQRCAASARTASRQLVRQQPEPPQVGLVAPDALALPLLLDALEVDVGAPGRRRSRAAPLGR